MASTYDYGRLGKRIKVHRKYRKITQRDLSQLSGVSMSTISKLEQGVAKNVTIEKINAIAAAMGISLSELVVDYDEEMDYTQYIDPDSPEDEEWDNERQYINMEKLQSLYTPVYQNYKVHTLIDFLIYLPLIDQGILCDALCRIDGGIYNKEDYALNVINNIIRAIPQSQARAYADAVNNLNRKIAEKKSPNLYRNSGEAISMDLHNAYSRLLRDKQFIWTKMANIMNELKDVYEKSSTLDTEGN